MSELLLHYLMGALLMGLSILLADLASRIFAPGLKPMRHDAFVVAMVIWPAALVVFLHTVLRGRR